MKFEKESFEDVSLLPGEVRGQLQDQGYANVPVMVNNQDTHELFQLFKRLVALTQEPGGEKLMQAVTYKARPDDQLLGNESYFMDLRLPGVHNPHENKSRAAGKDHKYIFHYGPNTMIHAQRSFRSAAPEELIDLLEQCEYFYQAGRSAARLGAAALGLSEVIFAGQTQEVHHLRLIDYIASSNGEHAEAHFDRSVATLAINESHPGLRGAPADNGFLQSLDAETITQVNNLQPVSHREGIAKFFASAGLRRLPEALRTDQNLDSVPLFAHDVVNEKPGVNRQAVVMFFNPHLNFEGYSVPSKEETAVQY